MSNQPSLFSLSLSIGQSFDLKINCTNFLNELRVVKDLDFASVWIKNKLLNTDLPSSQVTLVCHVPVITGVYISVAENGLYDIIVEELIFNFSAPFIFIE